jgi:hypothetical protein
MIRGMSEPVMKLLKPDRDQLEIFVDDLFRHVPDGRATWGMRNGREPHDCL